MPEINLMQASQQVHVPRAVLLKAVEAKQIATTSTTAPWMVVLADVEAWVRANPSVVLQAPPSLLPDPLTARVTTLETTVAEHAAFIAKLKADLAKP
jgi:hypothetical protein